MAAGGSESPGPRLNPLGRTLVDTSSGCQKEGRQVDVLPGLVSKEAWGVCGASLHVSSAVTVKSC